MTPVLEWNAGTANTLPGPVDTIVCQSGQGVVVDHTTDPATCTVLSTDETYDAEGKAGLAIFDIDGSRWFVESSLENRTDSQMVDTPGTPQQLTDVHGEPTGPYVPPENGADPAEHPEPQAHEVKGDNDPTDGHETGTYESRSRTSLYELAKERDLEVTSKSTKDELIAALRGE